MAQNMLLMLSLAGSAAMLPMLPKAPCRDHSACVQNQGARNSKYKKNSTQYRKRKRTGVQVDLQTPVESGKRSVPEASPYSFQQAFSSSSSTRLFVADMRMELHLLWIGLQRNHWSQHEEVDWSGCYAASHGGKAPASCHSCIQC